MGENLMTRRDATVLVRRALALLLTVLALSETTYLPEHVQAIFHHFEAESRAPGAHDYLSHYYLVRLTFLVTRIIGLTLLARWIYKGGSEVEELLLPSDSD
jgi:hypothetical protein